MDPAALSSRPRTLALGSGFVLVWCTGYIAGKLAVVHAGAFTTLLWRFGLSALVFIGLAALAGAAWPTPREWLHSAVSGVLMLALQFGGVYWAFAQGANAGLAALAIGCMPLLVAWLASIGGDERIGPRDWSGMALGLIGVALVVADRLQPVAAPLAWMGLLAGLLGISIGTVYQKRHASALDPRVGLAVQNAAAALVLLPFAWSEGFRFVAAADFFAPLAWMVLVNSVGGFTLLFVLIRQGAASAVAALFFLMPPVTAVFGHVWLGEAITPLKGAGFALSALGVWLATHSARRRAG